MTPEHLRSWLKHRPAGAQRLQLVHDTLPALVTVADWERDEIDTEGSQGDADLAVNILAAAQDFTDGEGEKCKFLIRWIGSKDRPLKVKSHHVKPSDPEGETPQQTISDASVIRDLLRHLEAKERVMQSSLTTITQGYERTINMLSSQLEAAIKQLHERPEAPPAAPLVLTEEQREESIQRAEALKAFTGKLPEVMDLALAAAASRLLPPASGQGSGEGDPH